MIPVLVGQINERGRVRPTNEDWIGVQVPQDPWWATVKGAIFAVADGMGGHRAGHVASRLAVETVLWAYYRDPYQDVAAALEHSVQAAHQRILQVAAKYPTYQGMGTTLVAAVICGNELVVAHVGDSRAYLLRTGQLWPLTRDHTWVAEEVALGGLTASQANHHPWRNLLTRSLGKPGPLRVDLMRLRLFPTDMLLLCTDGLSDRVWDQEIAQTVAWYDPPGAAQQLAALANARGGDDNISVVLVRFVGQPGATRTVASPARGRKAGEQRGRGAGERRSGLPPSPRPPLYAPRSTLFQRPGLGQVIGMAIGFTLTVVVIGVVMLAISRMVGAGG